MSNVSKLNEHVRIPHEPNPKVIALLESMLAEAKRGEIFAIALSIVSADGGTSSGVSIPAGIGVTSKMLGALERLKYRLMQNDD